MFISKFGVLCSSDEAESFLGVWRFPLEVIFPLLCLSSEVRCI